MDEFDLDAHSLRPKEDSSTLKENNVIFITENDVIGKGKPLYRIERRFEETGELESGQYELPAAGKESQLLHG